MDENPCDILTTAPGRTDACKHGHVDRLPRLPPITPDYTRNLRAITLWNTRCCAPARLRRMSMSPINRPWRRRGPDPGAQEHGSGTDPASGALPARPRRVPPKPRQYPLDMRVLNFFFARLVGGSGKGAPTPSTTTPFAGCSGWRKWRGHALGVHFDPNCRWPRVMVPTLVSYMAEGCCVCPAVGCTGGSGRLEIGFPVLALISR